jgi:HD superfamily phosphohydrolase YqeK
MFNHILNITENIQNSSFIFAAIEHCCKERPNKEVKVLFLCEGLSQIIDNVYYLALHLVCSKAILL